MAYIGDVVPYEQRQQVLGRFLTGQISGLLFGQVAGGVLGDLFGWRNVFFILGGIVRARRRRACLRADASIRRRAQRAARRQRHGGLIAEYAAVLRTPWARYRADLRVRRSRPCSTRSFAYIGADLHRGSGRLQRWSAWWSAASPSAGCSTPAMVKLLVNRLGQVGLVIAGGAIAVGWLSSRWRFSRSGGSRRPRSSRSGSASTWCTTRCQTNATQMTPQARGTAVAIFSSALYMGITRGRRAWRRRSSTVSAPCRFSSSRRIVLSAGRYRVRALAQAPATP